MLRRTMLLAFMVAGAASRADEAAVDEAASPAAAETAQVAVAQPKPEAAGSKTLSGISILGNQEAPKALVIVPWKSSEIGDPLGLDENLDGSRRPVDREVFMRELDYYDIRSGSE
jgi:Tfp pilus assembly protein PilX